MSKIGRKPISITQGVTVIKEDGVTKVRGSLGEISVRIPNCISLEMDNEKIVVSKDESREAKPLAGTYIRLMENAILGVSKGFEKVLEIVGTGFRAQMEGETLVLSLGFSHQIKFITPEGIKLSVEENKVKVFGANKETVGTTAHKIKMFKKPDSYKGKGIRYLGEKLRLKPGKAAAKAGATAGK